MDDTVSDSKRAESKLKNKKAKENEIAARHSDGLRDLMEFTTSVVEIVQDGLIAVDEKQRILFFNKAAQKILEYDQKRVIGEHISEIFSEEEMTAILATGYRAGEARIARETEVSRLDGEKISIGYSTTVFTDEEGTSRGHIITFRDLTEINRMQEEILRMDRLASLGEISSGIAHEIRNPLAAIKTTAQAMEEELEKDDPQREFLIRIVKEIDRLDSMLRTFFSFAKPRRPMPTRCDIRDVVREVLLLLNKDINNNMIEVMEKYPDNLPAVNADFNQMQQVFLNLFLNSINFKDPNRKNTIFITAWVKTQKKTNVLEISVADTGIGIDEEHLDKIFDPFFTTRARGTGLGLSITYRIIQRHGGTISVKSVVGEGTTFNIRLPAVS